MNKDPHPNTISKYTTTKAPDSETVGVSEKRVPDLPFHPPGSRRNPHNDSKHQLLRDKENLDSLREFYRYLWWCHIHEERAVIVGVHSEMVQEIMEDMGLWQDFEEENTGDFLKDLEEKSEESLLDRLRRADEGNRSDEPPQSDAPQQEIIFLGSST